MHLPFRLLHIFSQAPCTKYRISCIDQPLPLHTLKTIMLVCHSQRILPQHKIMQKKSNAIRHTHSSFRVLHIFNQASGKNDRISRTDLPLPVYTFLLWCHSLHMLLLAENHTEKQHKLPHSFATASIHTHVPYRLFYIYV